MRPFDVAVTLLTTASFPGGWLIQSNLNISALTAASKLTQSHSSKASLGQSYHGSVWATAVMESLIKMKDSKTTQYQPGTRSADGHRLFGGRLTIRKDTGACDPKQRDEAASLILM